MITQTFKVNDMSCSSCVMRIEELEDKLPGVQKIAVNFKKHQMTASFDESAITAQTIAEAVTKLGYPATPAEQKEKRGFLPWKR